MNAQIQIQDVSAVGHVVTGWLTTKLRVKGRTLSGYVLTGDNGVLGFINTLGPHPRIEELLADYAVRGTFTARGLMRDLLNAEDYRSTIYDAMVRVYYPEDFANV